MTSSESFSSRGDDESLLRGTRAAAHDEDPFERAAAGARRLSMSRRRRAAFEYAQPSQYSPGTLPTARNVGFVGINEFDHSISFRGFVRIADPRMHGGYVTRHVGRGNDIGAIELRLQLAAAELPQRIAMKRAR